MATADYKPTKIELKFEKYYKKLIWETIFARAHLKLWERLEKYRSSYPKEMNQAPHFFNLTIKSHSDDALLTLSRILDKHEKALSIRKFLNFAEQNIDIFTTQAFEQRERHKPNFLEYWIENHKPVTPENIKEDRQKLKSLEHTIDDLITWRDKVLAHTDRKFLLKGIIIPKEHLPQPQRLQEIIEALDNILNRYSLAYDSSTYLVGFPSEDDVQFVMNSIRFHLKELKKPRNQINKNLG